MVEMRGSELIFRFPQVHEDAVCRVSFQRTLRIPDDNRSYPLPPGLGRFPLEHVQMHSPRLPAAWSKHGGVLLPMYQSEAMWINFDSETGGRHSQGYPFAIKVAAGKINAISGEAWGDELVEHPQDYVVVPDQPWLDGFCIQKGLIRQFVAMPLGQGYSAEEQLTGEAVMGGLQIIVYPMKKDHYKKLLQKRESMKAPEIYCSMSVVQEPSMGLAPGGLMHQEIYEDRYGFDAWETGCSSRCFVHILNSEQWAAAIGKPAPGQAPTAAEYTDAGLPWFEYYNDQIAHLPGATSLAALDSVAAKGIKLGQTPLKENDPVTPGKVVGCGPKSDEVKDGTW